MKAPHPPGWAVHRGYSWPGLEKVSGALSKEDDEELNRKLREVQDYKVRPLAFLSFSADSMHHLLWMEAFV